MLLSSLLRNQQYARHLLKFCDWAEEEHSGSVRVPSITRLQEAIEEAWNMGFDSQASCWRKHDHIM